MKKTKIDTSGTEAAQAATTAAQVAANNLQMNASKDLGTENLTTAIAGGSAIANEDSVIGSTSRKRRASGGLASTLGINV